MRIHHFLLIGLVTINTVIVGIESESHLFKFLQTLSYKRTPKSTADLIKQQGYPALTYETITKDGYILQIHRIPHGKGQENEVTARPPVYLQHCLLCSSSDFIMNTPENALAYILADKGYDVWLGNARGNTYSRKHISLSPSDPLFWRFSWDEMGKYDAPAIIDLILRETDQKQLFYIGFSMGTTIFFTMMHHNPEYNDKVKGMVALAPVAYTKNIKGPLGKWMPYSGYFESMMRFSGVYEFLPRGAHTDFLASQLCNKTQISTSMCRNGLFLLTGPNLDQFNQDFLPLILTHTPAGTSVQTVGHFLQVGITDEFKRYDYGFLLNFITYRSMLPPKYNLSAVTSKVVIYSSDNDWLATPENVERLSHELPNVVEKKKMPSNFTHLDFIWAKDAAKYIYEPLLKSLWMLSMDLP